METDAVLEPVIGGNVYPKYTTRNPLARMLVDGFLRDLDDLVRATGAKRIHEVGCGEGHLTVRLAERGLRVRGSDLSASAIEQARRRARALGVEIDLRVADLHALRAPNDGAELVVCCEVLEHVPDPERAIAALCELARPHLILSVPREPLWRILNMARGRYLRDFGNTPGHLQHFSTRRFIELVAQFTRVEEIRTPLPWTMLRCRVRDAD